MQGRNLSIVIIILVVAGLAGTGLAGGEELFDVKRSQREIEIMRGILRTSLSFAAEELEAPFSRRDWSSIDGFYLFGQGAVFIISIPGPEVAPVYSVWSPSVGADREYRLMSTAPRAPRLARTYYAESLAALEAGEAEQAEVEEHLAQLELLQEVEADAPEIAEQIKEAKARAEQRQREIEKLQSERAERMARYRVHEYVTLVLSPSVMAFGLFGEESGLPARVISVKKSTITAYKTGKLSEDAFRKAVLRYTN